MLQRLGVLAASVHEGSTRAGFDVASQWSRCLTNSRRGLAARTGNMMLFDAGGRIRRFGSPEEIIEAFAPLRLEFYHKRKAHLLQV